MNILITGGLGYIGSHTVIECINNNNNVIDLFVIKFYKKKIIVLIDFVN